MSQPKVSVLMSVYNGEKHLREAIDSILGQSFADFEFLIINDASTDASRDIITSYSDPRIRLIDNVYNIGLTKSLNRGLDLTDCQYIARMDCDDISLPHRLAKQVAFMDTHPEVGVCGAWVHILGHREQQVWEYPTDHRSIISRMIFECALAHPSVIMNRKLLAASGLRYDEDCRQAQDYELWARCANFCQLANLSEVLVAYRLHEQQIGRQHTSEQARTADLVREGLLRGLGIATNEAQLKFHRRLSERAFEPNEEFLMEADAWLRKLQDANSKLGCFPEPEFPRVLAERWYGICRASAVLGVRSWQIFENSPLGRAAGLSLMGHFKLLLNAVAKRK